MQDKKDLLLELYVEEIPPFELYNLNDFFKTEIENFLKENDISFEEGILYSTPRRVAYYSKSVSSKQEDKEVTIYGPYKHIAFDSNNQPTKALLGFLKGKNKKIEDIKYEKDKKGERIFFKELVKGQSLEELLNLFFSKILMKKAPFKKSMKWSSNNYTFIRPIHSILALHGNEPIKITFENIISGKTTRGHLILANKQVEINSPSEYAQKLKELFVIPTPKEREEIILSQIKSIEEKHGFEVIIDDYLLKEVVNIVECPNAFIGSFSEDFLVLPEEVLTISMKKHQKYFPIYKKGKICPNFLGVANMPLEGRKAIIHGNERVLRARLSDAKFFYEDDLKKGLDILIPKLKDVLFQQKLGSYGDKVLRIEKIANYLNEKLGYNIDSGKIKKSSSLLKVDLLTGMVGEFAGLQGIVGTHYAKKLGVEEDISLSIMEHYQPKTVNDEVPKNNLSILMALSDKLDTLVGGFIAGLEPTGSKDPFALRRASLSILKIMTEQNNNLELKEYFITPIEILKGQTDDKLLEKLIDFFKERLKFFLKNSYKPDVVEAVTSKSNIINKTTLELCEALNKFKEDEESRELILLIKRITNILKDDLFTLEGNIDEKLLQTTEEKNLYDWLKDNSEILKSDFENNKFEIAFKRASSAYKVLDDFFDKVFINVEDVLVKKNRQLILKNMYDLFTLYVSIEKLVIENN